MHEYIYALDLNYVCDSRNRTYTYCGLILIEDDVLKQTLSAAVAG